MIPCDYIFVEGASGDMHRACTSPATLFFVWTAEGKYEPLAMCQGCGKDFERQEADTIDAAEPDGPAEEKDVHKRFRKISRDEFLTLEIMVR